MIKTKELPLFGYCAVTCDFIHVGHINFLRQAKSLCNKLIVGVMTDNYIKKHKKRKPMMNQNQRAQMVYAMKYVDNVVFQDSFEFPHNVLSAKEFWGKDKYIIIDTYEHKRKAADVIIRRTYGISSTKIRKEIKGSDLSKRPL